MSLTKDEVSDLNSLIERASSTALALQNMKDAKAEADRQLANWLSMHTEKTIPQPVRIYPTERQS